jgi:chromate transporter
MFIAAGVLTAGVATWRMARDAERLDAAGAALLALSTTPAAGVALAPTLSTVFWVFVKAGAFVFGSGLAIVPFLYGEIVQAQGWLNDRQFLDAVAVAMITPGPVVITVAFIGLPAPYFRRYRSQPQIKGFVEGVSAAATGAIAGAAWVLATRALVDVWTAMLALAALVVLWRWKVSELWLIGGGALVGWLVAGAARP